MRQMIKTSPFPRYERQGLMEMSNDGQYFVMNPAIVVGLTDEERQALRATAIKQLANHFEQPEVEIEDIVFQSIG
jgi:hypothetical protein